MVEDAATGRGHALRLGTGPADADERSFRRERARRPQHHARDHAALGQRVARDPVDEAPHRRRDRRRVKLAGDGAQAVVADLQIGRIVPDNADHVAGAERRLDDIARPESEVGRRPIGVRRRDGDGNHDGNRPYFRHPCRILSRLMADDGLAFG
jgi:hypothetical protein